MTGERFLELNFCFQPFIVIDTNFHYFFFDMLAIC